MEIVVNLIRFFLILGVLIFIHEAGHFMVAKKVGIYIFRFSIGFGKKLFGFKSKETEYCISAIPFGGYVKMAGQEDVPSGDDEENLDPDTLVDVPENQKFYNKTVWQRFLVVFAGPAMNFILGIVLFIVVFYVGIHVPVYLKNTLIGEVIPNSPAAEADIRVGDTILEINSEPVTQWRQITRKTIFSIGEKLELSIKRGDKIVKTTVVPSYYDKKANPGIGVFPYIKSVVNEVVADNPAQKAGLQPDDVIIGVNNEPVSLTNISRVIRQNKSPKIILNILRGDEKLNINISPNKVGGISGIEFLDNVAVRVDAEKYPSLKPGDKLVKIDDVRVKNIDDINGYIENKINQSVNLSFERAEGNVFIKKVKTISVQANITSCNKIGVYFKADDTTVLERYPIHIACAKGIKRAFVSVGELFTSIYYLIIGRISPRELAGPIGIYKITADFAASGFIMLLSFIGFLSVNLSVINLLPIPVLDGGHVVFLLIEAVRRKPLSDKVMEILQKIGFVLLMALIVYTLYNDIVHRLIGN
ncbi:RIP metalloprotease RseP [bacterium]|nr:RIP metalloprotease RseP [bacterium]